MTIAKGVENKSPSADRDGAIPPIQGLFSSECLRNGALAIGISMVAETVPNAALKEVVSGVSVAFGAASCAAGAFLKLVRQEIVAVTPELGRQIVAERLSRTSIVCGDYGAFFKH
ncbi:MAG TPA: hypothetical protein VGZ00_01035 [Candidatus Baltobacteraceae bacterium]|jgi:hypothetical protein|nr:hypothetical protein [Candidatus Baltobacteraceae bacterium]